jgi:2-dehydropantoate 2-reductase
MKIAVMGAGAVGCYYGGRLAQAGHTVTLIGRPRHVEAIAAAGLRLESGGAAVAIPIGATTEPAAVADADLVLFCVKSGDTAETGRAMRRFLAPATAILCLQNGVDNADRLQAVLGRPVIPAAVYVATDMPGAGHVRHHGRGELVIGPGPASEAIATAFSAAAIPTAISANVIGVLWGKLIVNCAYNAISAVAGLPYGRLPLVAGVTDVQRDVVAECLAVAAGLGITVPGDILDTVLSLPPTMPNQFSSTAQDLAQGKPTEIDHLNGYVVQAGARLGIATPVNRALLAMVKLIESKTR